eukprot:1753567-Pyramimonas_sp.AAC.1
MRRGARQRQTGRPARSSEGIEETLAELKGTIEQQNVAIQQHGRALEMLLTKNQSGFGKGPEWELLGQQSPPPPGTASPAR